MTDTELLSKIKGRIENIEKSIRIIEHLRDYSPSEFTLKFKVGYHDYEINTFRSIRRALVDLIEK